MITADELIYMQTTIESLLPGTCAVLTGTSTADGFGGVTFAWGTTTTYTCRLDARGGKDALAAGEIQPFHQYVLTLPHSAVITEANRVVVSSETYNVVSVDANKSWAACVRAIVERI
jgi:head-tail adaptor